MGVSRNSAESRRAMRNCRCRLSSEFRLANYYCILAQSTNERPRIGLGKLLYFRCTIIHFTRAFRGNRVNVREVRSNLVRRGRGKRDGIKMSRMYNSTIAVSPLSRLRRNKKIHARHNLFTKIVVPFKSPCGYDSHFDHSSDVEELLVSGSKTYQARNRERALSRIPSTRRQHYVQSVFCMYTCTYVQGAFRLAGIVGDVGRRFGVEENG